MFYIENIRATWLDEKHPMAELTPPQYTIFSTRRSGIPNNYTTRETGIYRSLENKSSRPPVQRFADFSEFHTNHISLSHDNGDHDDEQRNIRRCITSDKTRAPKKHSILLASTYTSS
ncbi:hypothetical protein GWI33_004726 [Rhynchophorus ferrugineus]|uniref:Uncharacterized protein n=1 Tax=Rhynchophorus ferrugineus TaxID=354439 RepID=A0A834IIH4_RHYFE|nr:hypothetical protein GWI33_004726 [Rhynchophorus ferrugineus]